MQKVYIGSYTKHTSKGIYTADFNPQTGQLSNLDLFIPLKNPTYLTTDKVSNRLFAVADIDGKGGINIYDLNSRELLTSFLEEGNPPCFVDYDPDLDTTFDANYHRGMVHVYQGATLDKTFQYGAGSHAHYVKSYQDSVYVCDLGLDAVRKYRLLNEIATYNTPAGSGPRHLTFHPTQPILYVFCELSSEIIVLRDDEFDLTHLQTITTIPEGVTSSGAAIRISNDGQFLYASNRGHDSIAVFRVNEDFTLTLIQDIPCGGEHPRDFDLTPNEEHVIVANRDTNNLAVFARDAKSGQLTFLNNDFTAPEAVCIHFIR